MQDNFHIIYNANHVFMLNAVASLALLGVGMGMPVKKMGAGLLAWKQSIVTLLAMYVFIPSMIYLFTLSEGFSPNVAAGLTFAVLCPGGAWAIAVAKYGGAAEERTILTVLLSLPVSILMIPFIFGVFVDNHPLFGFLADVRIFVDIDLWVGFYSTTIIIPLIVGMIIRALAPAMAERAVSPVQLFAFVLLIAYSIKTVHINNSAMQTTSSLTIATLALLQVTIYGGMMATALIFPSKFREIMAGAFALGMRHGPCSFAMAMIVFEGHPRIIGSTLLWAMTSIGGGLIAATICQKIIRPAWESRLAEKATEVSS